MLRAVLRLPALASLSLSLWLSLWPAAPAAAQGPPPIRDGAFVRADGVDFAVEGARFHVVGANAAVMHGRAHREAMAETLAAAAADGMSVVRVWALGEYPEGAPSWAQDYAFRIGPTGWVEASFAHLDAVLAEARRLGLRVIVVLANRWGDYGGTTEYLRWTGTAVEGRALPPLGLAAFWECRECEALYREHVRRVVLPRIDDPTIFAWELMNEAEAAGTVGEAAMLAWMERQAALIHELDPNHMVSAGHIGYSSQRERALWRAVCALDGVDYCDAHAYPLRNGRVRSAAELSRWIDDRVQLARFVVQKPFLWGEIGVRSDRHRVLGRARSDWIGRFFARTFAGGAAGALVWTYLPSPGPRRTYAIYTGGERARETRDLRRALARQASVARRRAPRTRNRALGVERGDAPIFDSTRLLAGTGVVHEGWEGGRLRIDPRDFARARFENVGAWDGDERSLPHFYGGGAGHVSYRFRDPGVEAGTLTVRLRASSELPGGGLGASEADVSGLRVFLDDVELGAVTAPADDGVGAWIELRVDAPMLPARRVRHLRIEADGSGAGGLCLYARDLEGAPTGVELLWTPLDPS